MKTKDVFSNENMKNPPIVAYLSKIAEIFSLAAQMAQKLGRILFHQNPLSAGLGKYLYWGGSTALKRKIIPLDNILLSIEI